MRFGVVSQDLSLLIQGWRDFPDGAAAKTRCSQYRGPGFDPCSGN